MRFVIPGRPHGKRRPRVALRRGNRVVTFTPRDVYAMTGEPEWVEVEIAEAKEAAV